MRNHHSLPAAVMMGFVLCLAGFSLVMFSILASGQYGGQVLPITDFGNGARHIGGAAGLVILLGYVAGVVGWLAAYTMRRDGKHRVEALFTALGETEPLLGGSCGKAAGHEADRAQRLS